MAVPVQVRKLPAPDGALRLAVNPVKDTHELLVRTHPAPEGALRQMDCVVLDVRSIVRKRPAPEGALRQRTGRVDVEGHVRQKAPGTRKCIKAGQLVWGKQTPNQVRKLPAPEGALRR